MLRKLALSMAVAGAIASSQANALGLGNIRIKSALNEPLNAEIQLNQVKDLNPLQIRPRMAGQDEFALAGISQQRALSDVRFQVKVNPNGTGVIELTTQQPVKEPFLNFLVEVNWPSGRLVREYTLLLDPPVFSPVSTQQPIAPAVTRPAPQPVNPPPVAQSTTTSSSSANRNTGTASNIRTRANPATEAYVDVSDTLWEIAIRHRVKPDVSSYQMMVAMYKKNPQAFTSGNINDLKAGVVLKLPTEAEARALTSKEAAAEVRRQTNLWKGRDQAPAPAPMDASKSSAKTDAADSDSAEAAQDGQLTVVTPSEKGDKDDAASATTQSGESQTNEELSEELAVAREEIDRLTKQNERLQKNNEDILAKLDALAERLDQVTDKEEEAPVSQLEVESPEEVALLKQQLAQAQQEIAAKDAALAEKNRSFLDTLLQSPAMLAGLGGGLLALLAGALLLARRKRKQKEEEGDDNLALAGAAGAAGGAAAIELTDEDDEALLAALNEDSDESQDEVANNDADEIATLDDLENLDDLESLDDLDELNLDMDLDLDENLDTDLASLESSSDDEIDISSDADDDLGDLDSILNEDLDLEDSNDDSVSVDDIEFDLGLDEDEIQELETVDLNEALDESVDDELDLNDLDDSLDAMLNEAESEEVAVDTTEDEDLLDSLFEESGVEDERIDDVRAGLASVAEVEGGDEVEDTLESLGLNGLADQAFDAEGDSTSDDDGDLDFNLDDLDAEVDGMDLDQELSQLEAELDGLDFTLDDLDEQSLDDVEDNTLAADLTEEADLALDEDEGSALDDLDDVLETETRGQEAEAALDEESLMADLDSLLDEEAPTSDSAIDEEMSLSDLELEGETLEGLDDGDEEIDLDALLAEDSLTLEDDIMADLDKEIGGYDIDEEGDSLDDLLDLELDEVEPMSDVDTAGLELDDDLPRTPSDEEVSEELTNNIKHDLEPELNDELDELLGSTDNDIALEETSSDEEMFGESDDPLDALGLLDGADEVETKLDLARAYIDMGDLDGAKDILSEIQQEGSDEQVEEARSLMEGLS